MKGNAGEYIVQGDTFFRKRGFRKRCGIRLVPNSRLLRSHNNVLENGELAIFKREKTCAEPLNHDNLGKAYILHYLTKDDVNVFIEAGML